MRNQNYKYHLMKMRNCVKFTSERFLLVCWEQIVSAFIGHPRGIKGNFCLFRKIVNIYEGM